MNETPKERVMRFYGNTDYALECIALKEITYIHVDKLNDPFDLSFTFDMECNDYDTLLRFIQESHPLKLENFKKTYSERFVNDVLKNLKRRGKYQRKNSFVFSTCAVEEDNHPKKNLYMWSHYGDGHRGIAIEFNTTVLTESVNVHDDSDGKEPWGRVKYDKEIPKITCENIFEVFTISLLGEGPYAPGFDETARKQFLNKGEVWKTENEYRIVRYNDETKMKIYRHNILENAITAVYLGCETSKEDQGRFIHETARNFPNAEIYKCEMRPGEHALDFKQII